MSILTKIIKIIFHGKKNDEDHRKKYKEIKTKDDKVIGWKEEESKSACGDYLLPENKDSIYTIDGNVKKKSTEEIIKNELKLWGIDETLFCYKVILELPNVDIAAKDLSYSNILTALSNKLGKNNGTIARSIKALISKADFNKSEYSTIREINKEENTYNIMVALLAFCISIKSV